MSEHAAKQELSFAAGSDGDWEGRVRVLMPAEYDKHPWSFFRTYKGNSWHGGDARFIFWLGKNWVLVTAVGFALGAVVGVVVWWAYARLVGMGRRRAQIATARSRSGSPGSESDQFGHGIVGWVVQGGAGAVAGSTSTGPKDYKMPWWRTVLGAGGKGKGMYELVEQHDA